MTAMITSFLGNKDEENKKLEAKAEEPKPLIDDSLKKLKETTQNAQVAAQVIQEEPEKQPQVKADETPAEQMIVDSTSEPVKKVNEYRNGKQTHLVSL